SVSVSPSSNSLPPLFLIFRLPPPPSPTLFPYTTLFRSNYCTKHQTSFADIEVTYKNEKTKLWKIAYPTLDKIGEIIVATTRPETDRKSTRLNSSHVKISYAVFCLKKKKQTTQKTSADM